MAPSSHAAFPSVGSGEMILPRTEQELRALSQSCTSLEALRDQLIPSLFKLAVKAAPAERKKGKKPAVPDDILSMSNTDIYAFSSDEIISNTALLVFTVSARLDDTRKSKQASSDLGKLLNLAAKLCETGDAVQLRLCGPRVTSLAWGMIRAGQRLQQVNQVTSSLMSVCSRARVRHAFWGVYAVLLEACLLARQFEPAAPLLEDAFVDFRTYGPSYLDVITFYHHAGYILAATGNFGAACTAFITAVSAPTAAVSAIQLACAKRAILCGLLHDGKMVRFPPYCSSAVTRVIDRSAKEYTKLGRSFADSNWSIVQETAASPVFAEDKNKGLLSQIIESIPRRRILAIRRHYSRILVSDLARRIHMTGQNASSDLETLLRDMIETGELRAILSTSSEQQSPMVTFLDESEEYTSPAKLRELAKIHERAAWLRSELLKANRSMGMSREYLETQVAVLEQKDRQQLDSDIVDEMDDAVPPDVGGEVAPGVRSKDIRRGARARGTRGAGGNLMDTGF